MRKAQLTLLCLIASLSAQAMSYRNYGQIFDSLAQGRIPRNQLSERAVDQFGVELFLGLDDRVLERINHPRVWEHLLTSAIGRGQVQKAMNLLPKIRDRAAGLFYSASLEYLRGNFKLALGRFEECAKKASQFQDRCKLGVPRTYFALQDYPKAKARYAAIDKRSFLWPNVLLEDAWASFYLNEYNRTLGRLVTYQAPILERFWSPEVVVLKSLSFLHLCQYQNATFTIDRGRQRLRQELRSVIDVARSPSKILKAVLAPNPGVVAKRALMDPIASRYLAHLRAAINEREVGLRSSSRPVQIIQNLLVGYVRRVFANYVKDLRYALTGLGQIKLEVLGRTKQAIYQNRDLALLNGDIQYLRRSPRQYFWSFNGEFWADELGDYVFALPSLCPSYR